MAEYEGKRIADAQEQEPSAPPAEKKGWKWLWKEWGGFAVTLLAVLILGKVVFQLAWVPSGSMETTIPTKSLQICWRLPYFFGDPAPQRGQILTFRSDERNEIMVKRVVGLPGETVSFLDGNVYIDGELLQEDYLSQTGITLSERAFTVPEGCVFFLGDNRMGSFDARYWQEPYIPFEKVQARVLVTISVGGSHSWQGIRLTGK